jgi:ABC-type transport system involved in multi-copper enzyme maturation permease subunit
MLEQLVAIFKNTFLESIRQPIYLILIGIGILALVLNLNLSAFTMDDDNKFLIDMGMATTFLVGLLIAAFTSTSVIAEEIANRTVLTVVAKPVGRPLFILGKYLGVAAAVVLAVIVMTAAFLLTVRHGVLQNASDKIDYPVILFGLAAIVLSLGIGMAANYLYGWVFTSTTVGTLLPMSILAYIASLAFDEDWHFQLFSEEATMGISPDLRPEFLLATYGIVLALLVLCAIAIAVSTRFGQVMTLFTCVLVFMAGLLSDYFFVRHAYDPYTIARIMDVQIGRDIDENFSDDGDWYEVTLDRIVDLEKYRMENEFEDDSPVPIYLAGDSLGRSMLGPMSIERDRRENTLTRAIALRNITGQRTELVNIGGIAMSRPPFPGDYVHGGMPRLRFGWRFLWGIPPNLQSMVFTDAITQRHVIPLDHLILITLYSILYILAALCLAVILFQKREVG